MGKHDAEQFWERYDQFEEKDLYITTKTGISQSTLSTWKSRGTFPRADIAYKIASALNTTVEFLVAGWKPNENALSSFMQEMEAMVSPFSKDEEELDKLIKLIGFLIQLGQENGRRNMMDVIDLYALKKRE